MELFYTVVSKERYSFINNIFILSLFLVICLSFLDELTVLAQEDLDILINEDSTATTTNDDKNTNQQEEEDKPIKLDSTDSSLPTPPSNFWNDIFILVLGISVAISLYFLIKYLIKKSCRLFRI